MVPQVPPSVSGSEFAPLLRQLSDILKDRAAASPTSSAILCVMAFLPQGMALVLFLASVISIGHTVRDLKAELAIPHLSYPIGKGTSVVNGRAKPPAFNDQPLIGILSQPGTGDGPAPRLRAPQSTSRTNDSPEEDVSYIAASYVKWVESAGGRAVPILYDDPDHALKAVCSGNLSIDSCHDY